MSSEIMASTTSKKPATRPAKRGSKPTASRKAATPKPPASKTPAAKQTSAKPGSDMSHATNSDAPATTPLADIVDSPIPAAPKPVPVVVTESTAKAAAPDLKKQELLAKVVARSGIAKRDAKPVVEAMLDILGEALQDGRDLNLNPMGKIVIKKSKPIANGTVLTTRVRLKEKMPKS